MNFKTLREASGMNLTEFSNFFNIAYRTIQNWDSGTRKPPYYVIELMRYKLEKEGKFKDENSRL